MKKQIEFFLSKIKNRIFCISKKKKLLISFFLILLLSSSIFAFGSVTKSSDIECCSTFVVEKMLPLTKSKSALISVSPYDKENSRFNQYDFKRELYDSNDAFYSIEPFQKVVIYNSLKEKRVNIDELDDLGTDLSILTTWSFGSHEDTKGNFYLKGLYLRLMFQKINDNYQQVASNFLLLFKNQADYLLNKMGIPEEGRTSEVYLNNIIGKTIDISCNDTHYTWMIANIIYDEGQIFSTCCEWFGNCILAFNHIFEKNSTDLELVYGLHNDVSRDSTLIKEIIDKYSGKASYQFVKSNLLEPETIDGANEKLSSINKNESPSMVVLAIFLGLIFIVFSFYSYFSLSDFNLLMFLSNVGFFVVSWAIFKLLKVLLNSSKYFSFLSLNIFFIVFAIYVLLIPTLCMLIRRAQVKKHAE